MSREANDVSTQTTIPCTERCYVLIVSRERYMLCREREMCFCEYVRDKYHTNKFITCFRETLENQTSNNLQQPTKLKLHIKMKLLTANFVTCAVKTCKSSPLSFPLHFRDAELEQRELAYNPVFLANILPRLDWDAIKIVAAEVCSFV